MKERILDVWLPDGRCLSGRKVTPGEKGLEWSEPGAAPAEGWLVPGFVDLHIHGGFGIDFMSATLEQVEALSGRLAAIGYEAWLPTTVTAASAEIKSALKSLPSSAQTPGFHLEGPFISPEFPGAQPPEFILDPTDLSEEWNEILDDPRLRVITLAPERPGALDLARRLAKRGVRTSMGHTSATYAQALAGIEAGVNHSTHTFNAMRGLHHREPGSVGAIMTEPRILAELIYDRIHVSFGAAKALLAAKGLDGVVAVSDSTMASGMPSGSEFEVWGHKVYLANGEVRLKSNGALAGSAITLADAFRNLGEDFGIETAVKLCCINPRKALKMVDEPTTWLVVGPDFLIQEVASC